MKTKTKLMIFAIFAMVLNVGIQFSNSSVKVSAGLEAYATEETQEAYCVKCTGMSGNYVEFKCKSGKQSCAALACSGGYCDTNQ